MKTDRQFEAMCSSCGAGIKNIFTYNGKPYGSTCILKVSGDHELYNHIKGLKRNFNCDKWLEKTSADKERKKREKQELEKRIKENNKHNAILIECINVELNNYHSDFLVSILSELQYQKMEELHWKVKNILIDKYAKQRGRRNSKKYKEAEDFIYYILYPEEKQT